MGKHYRRALALLRSTELIDEDAQARYLAARCLAETSSWEECLAVLGDDSNGINNSVRLLADSLIE